MAYRFLARDAHLVLSSLDAKVIPVRVLLDPRRDHLVASMGQSMRGTFRRWVVALRRSFPRAADG